MMNPELSDAASAVGWIDMDGVGRLADQSKHSRPIISISFVRSERDAIQKE